MKTAVRLTLLYSLILAAGTRIPTAVAQTDSATSGGTITGLVVDAATGAPIARATVTLTSADGFALLADSRRGPSTFSLARTTTTSLVGAYRFADLSIGSYRLHVQRIGYAPATLEVRLGDWKTSPLSIGLVVVPVRLEAVEVRGSDGGLFARSRAGQTRDGARVAAARARQRAFLSTDARELTADDVAESATLGGGDVFRSLQRLPGVDQYDDWSAKIWVRDNRWDHNRVYYDDLPLFDPLAALGRLSGVSADGIGAAFLHPGVRPVSLGGEGATRVDLRSRPAGGAGEWRGSTDVSRYGASASIERQRSDGSAGFNVNAHHTLGDWLPRGGALSKTFGDRFVTDAELTFRGDVRLADGQELEVSSLISNDARRALGGGSSAIQQDWGNTAGRITYRASLGSLATSHTIGVSHFASSSSRWSATTVAGSGATPFAVTNTPVTSNVDYLTFGGRIARRDFNGITAGYDVIIEHSSFAGPRQSLYWDDLSLERAARRDALSYGSMWSERRMNVGEWLTLESGARVDVGGQSGIPAARPAASLQMRATVSPQTLLSVGVSRTHQYVQAIDLPVVGQGETAPSLWLTSGNDVPVMTVDNAMVGMERWMSSGILLAANAYLRRTSGAIIGDPSPGPLTERPLFVDASEAARGVEMSVRKLTGRATGLIAYSYSHAMTTARDLAFPAAANRPHALDASTTFHLGQLNVGGAFTLTSGAAYTRTVFDAQTPSRAAPNAQRLPRYSTLDLAIDYTRNVHGTLVTGFAAMQNVLGTVNPTWYRASGFCEGGDSQPSNAPSCRDRDLLSAPVRFARTVGLRFVF